MKIYGSGMAGLLAGHMLRRFSPKILEKEKSLPNNHAALLRFRSPAVGIATGIPFKKVNVQKAIFYEDKIHTTANIRMSNAYALKVTGEAKARSIIDLAAGERFVAPDDFISTAAKSLSINYCEALTGDRLAWQIENEPQPIISTIPMPVLMHIVDYKDKPEFKFRPIWSLRYTIEQPVTSLYQTIYFPGNEDDTLYRASITGNELIAEYMEDPAIGSIHFYGHYIEKILSIFGFDRVKVDNTVVRYKYQEYGKLLPIDERIRKQFIFEMSNKFGIYSVGRFALWKQILMDDVVKDIGIVERFINDDYSRFHHHRS